MAARIALTILLGAVAMLIHAQDTEQEQLADRSIPLSPQAERFKKFGEYPMDYSTGVPHISIPLYEINVGNYKVPVSIAYHASGNKVQDIASPVGLGWTLMAGGCISRQKKGRIDEGPLELKREEDVDSVFSLHSWTPIIWNYTAIGKGFDTETDRFTYSFNGKHGVFRYDANDMSIKTIPYSPIKIEEYGGGYRIVDTDGISYYFLAEEKNRGDFTYGGTLETMTWYLSKITFADRRDSVVFTYRQDVFCYTQSRPEYYHQGMRYYYGPLWHTTSLDATADNSALHTTETSNMLLTQIQWQGNRIDFSYTNDREDCIRQHSSRQLPRLTAASVTSYDNNVVRTVTFDNQHYTGGTPLDKRMFLHGVTFSGSPGTSVSETYSFSYNSTQLPNYYNLYMSFPIQQDATCHEDYWGYYNGTSSDDWTPRESIIPVYAADDRGADRSVKESYAKAGVIERITYPTGGYTVFDFESNKLDNGTLWGGLRVRSIRNFDSSGTLLTEKSYRYSSSREAVSNLQNLYRYFCNYTYYYHDWDGRLIHHTGMTYHQVAVSQPVIPLTADYGFPVYYCKVTEYNGTEESNIGKTEYSYMESRASDYYQYEDESGDELRLYSPITNIDNGNITTLLTDKRVYEHTDGSYTLNSSESYHYEEVTRETFPLGITFKARGVFVDLSPSPVYPNNNIDDINRDFSYHSVVGVPSYNRLSSKEVRDYGAQVVTTTTYQYDPQQRTLEPIQESVSTSTGEWLTTRSMFPFEKSGQAYADMVAANMLVPVETRTYRGNRQTGSTQTAYDRLDGLILPTAYYKGKGTLSPELRQQFEYDPHGNLASVVKDNTDKTVLLWGYHGMHPVAKITGLSKSEVYAAIGDMVSTFYGTPADALIHSIHSISALSGAGHLTTCAWRPLVGAVSVKLPHQEMAYYSYDGMGRLSGIADNGHHAIEEYSYSYGAQNYVRTRTMTNASSTAYRERTDYYDGIGRKTETVARGASPTGNDLVTLTEYDTQGRVIKEWLPTAFSNATGDFVPYASFYSASRPYFGNDSRPYRMQEYEPCLSGKVLKDYGPGSAWADHNAAVGNGYRGNGSELPFSCRKYTASDDGISLTAAGNYESNQLYVVSTTDEDGNKSYTFKDKEGRLVLERREDESAFSDTYYVYDIYGNLAFVLPPAASAALTTGTWSVSTNNTLRDYAYNYRYDDRNRCVVKKLPGCEEITLAYDTADRLVSKQDGLQRLQGETTYYEYDIWGRQTAMGKEYGNGTKVPLLQNYYDNYDFITLPGLALDASAGGDSAFPGNASPNARGLLTGTRAYGADSLAVSCLTSYFYGERGRMVQSHTQNILGGVDDEYFCYNFTGTVASRKHVHTKPATGTLTEIYTNVYDHEDRLVSVTHKLDSHPQKQLSAYTYDEVGRLATKELMGRETVSYAYNIRNWPTAISSPLFTEHISYNASTGDLTPSSPRWGGSISAVSWRTGNASDSHVSQFSYNPLGWLTSTTYSGTGNYSSVYSYDAMGNVESIIRYGRQDNNSYSLVDDLTFTYNGNQVIKVDDTVSGPDYAGAFHFVDGANEETEYEYDPNGNMTKDSNKGISSIQYNLLNLPSTVRYTDGSTQRYVYDATGRKLQTIHQASLNNIIYHGDIETSPSVPHTLSAEEPMATTSSYPLGGVWDGGIPHPWDESELNVFGQTKTDYCGNVVYRNGIRTVLLPDGYITFRNNAPHYHYYLKDHLGNIRIVADSTGTVEQANHYYPFGALTGESTGSDVQRYKFNGKELDRLNNLNWYDQGARHYDAALTRFITIDPLAEKYYGISPYVFCMNNPLILVDPDGKEVINKFDQSRPSEQKATNLYINKLKDIDNSIIIFAHGVAGGNGISVSDNDKAIISDAYSFEIFLNKNSENWKNRFVTGENLQIVLFSCGTGSKGKFAQTLSMDETFLNVKIFAPSDDVTIYEDGSSSVDNNKSWIEYMNGEIHNIYSGELLPGTTEFENASFWEKDNNNTYKK